ncbi:MAG TPA: protein-disulfide reductase DsbD domain-containing protein [Terriglobales bacterium]|nr:protein-disulfide reductase DsbD domain-containing protein [Terriglobales bacterium]
MLKRGLLLFLLFGIAVVACAQAPPTLVSLISDQSAAKPGSTVWVGIRFQLPSGWHTYWANPGDSGEPPKVQWVLPSGWTAGPIEWPAPSRMESPAGVDYGYHDAVTLLTRIKVPTSAKPGNMQLTANLSWLVCKDICVPQKTTATLPLRIGPAAVPNNDAKQIIADAKAKLPKAVPADWKMNVMRNPAQLLLNFMPGAKVSEAFFFPLEQQIIENAAPQKLSATSVRSQLALKRDSGSTAAPALKGVLVLDGSNAYAVNIPIKK